MEASRVLWFAASLGLMVGLVSAQCPSAKYNLEHSSACCDNAYNMGGLFSTQICCRSDADSTKCYCDNSNGAVGEGCRMLTTTAAPTTAPPTQPPATSEATTQAGDTTGVTTAPATGVTTAPGGATTVPAGAPPTNDWMPPTTTDPPTTTPEPLCPVPGPVPRLLNSMVISQCDENGLVAFYTAGPQTNNESILTCHGVYLYNSESMMREIITTEYCWNNIKSFYNLEDWTVTGVLQQKEFPVKKCYITETMTAIGLTTILLDPVMQYFMDGIGNDNGCNPLGCMATPSIRQRLTPNCFVASYGTDNSTASFGVKMLGEARKVSVFLDGRLSQCSETVTPNGYPDITDADQTCYQATSDGANCGQADASAPVFCLTDTDEAVLMALTVADSNCDETKNSFKALFV